MTELAPSFLFSIVVPAYNYGPGLLKLVDLFLQSPDPDFEILIVDDGSKDNTEELFTKFQHPRVRYFKKANAERGAARNYGADRARGKYVCFFDQDDLPFQNFIPEAKACVKEFDSPEVFCVGLEVRSPQSTYKIENLHDPLNRCLLRGNFSGCGGIFVRREIFKAVRFEENRDIVGTEDWLFKLQLCARYPFRFWNKVTWAYMDTGNNSVYRFTEKELNSRGELLIQYLRKDSSFMARYGSFIPEITAMRDVYTALHLALSGHVVRPFLYLKRAFFKNIRGFMRRGVLGTVKRVLLNVIANLQKSVCVAK